MVFLAVGTCFCLGAVWPGAAMAQRGRDTIPSSRHIAAVQSFSDGDYRDLLKTFLAERRGAIKTAQSAWIDSICYHAMAGECYYEMGQLSDAMVQYTDAIRLYIAYANWMLRVQFPALRPGTPPAGRAVVTWGTSTRGSVPASFRGTMLMSRGELDHTDTIKQGGVVQEAMLFPVNAVEIVRCTALAIRRRTELLGPACAHDPLTGQLLTALRQPVGPPNQWSDCWVDVQRGLAEAAAGKDAQALRSLERSLLAEGRYDHPLTCVALVEMGKLALAQNNPKVAERHFIEATYSAAYYENSIVLEEAFRLASTAHLMQNSTTLYAPLVEAAGWARRNRYPTVAASTLMSLAEGYATLRQTKQAELMLGQARAVMSRRDMGAGRFGARHSMLSAMVSFQKGRIADGDKALGVAMQYMQHGSHRLYQIALTDQLFAGGSVTSRTASDLFADVLREPTARDWAVDPMESLATLIFPYPGPLERWFALALSLQRREEALEIADRIRRHRYFASLAFGGRLESLRWILEGPVEALDPTSVLRRQSLLVQYPDYKKLQDTARQIEDALEQMPVAPEDNKVAATQRKLLAELGKLSAAREAVLREIAVRREPAELVFPPRRTAKEIQKALPPGHVMLAFFIAQDQLYGFLMDQANYDVWRVGPIAPVRKKIEEMLREMGHFDANRVCTVKELGDMKWRTSATELLRGLLADSKADFTADFKQIIIVPDGLLWYVPFEALQVEIDGQPIALISRYQIRYAPTTGLAVSDGRRRKKGGKTGVVVGKLTPRDKNDVAEKAFTQLAGALPGTVALPNPIPGPASLYRMLLDRLIVYDDLKASRSGPYDWDPIPGGRGRSGNSLADWCMLPWGGPDVVILPGYHTAAEDGLKRIGSTTAGAGDEVFLSLCGLMSSGARTVLLTRWRTGGQIGFDLIREFVQELPHASPAASWQRAVLLAQESRLNLEAEPRVQPGREIEIPRADHPFFWAGYMLVDPGDPPKPADAPPPVLKIVPKQAPPPAVKP
ncbi:MAG: CHAT domain-containing protein [Pirellulales bacterium]|nr:CHAT domain-containing protein [Pirellulales bacterium]